MKAIHPVLMAVLSFVAVEHSAARDRVGDAKLEQQRKLLVGAERVDLARSAAIRICGLIADTEDRSLVSPTLVSDLVTATNSDDEGVSYFAVRSLALIGPSASSALPALNRLLERKRHPPAGTLILGISAVPQVENAIKVIQGMPVKVMPAVSERCDARDG